ncbi:hypothetical protein KM620_gp101 [Hyposidra talaca nucleopolyhedrovirus]|uniref:Uncharacterized protein n=1 Tax=Hyposidra talaca nucleopolyhedrovirus TaxID=1070315 RepID=A0A2Z4HI56_9ABAC|nr:hypothetical protein KM620_gp101 [Hyposidra talaca nucleopolyhedrovirus]AWW14461.1 hypothetical protein HytaNPV_gp101 [Hyposidra talaca nucleopolyhedrovirus]
MDNQIRFNNGNNEINFNDLYVCETIRCVRLVDATGTRYKCIKCAQTEPVLIDLIFKHELRPIQSTNVDLYVCHVCKEPTKTLAAVDDCDDCSNFCNNVYMFKINNGLSIMINNRNTA